MNFGKVHYEQQFCEIIMNLGQWFRRRCRSKDFLSGPLAVLLFGAAKPFTNFERMHLGNIHVKLYGILNSG